MRIEKRLCVEFDGFGDEAAVGVVGSRLDCREHSAEKFRQRMRTHSDAGDDAEPAAAALQRPEEIGIGAGVGDLDLAVGGHDLRLDEARRGRAIGLGEASETPAQDQAGDADRHAAAALDIAPALGRHFVIGMAPDGASFD